MHYSVLTDLQFPYGKDLAKNNSQSVMITSSAFSEFQDQFEKDMTTTIATMMEPYNECTENLAYLEFENMNEEVRSGYLDDRMGCVQMPNGKIVTIWDSEFCAHFMVKNGIVYERNWGPLKHDKRTKRAKKIKLSNCPVRRIYNTMEAYAEDYHGYYFHKGYQAYGYMTNPNGYYDWYQVGGRWALWFLIHSDDPFYITGEKTWANPETKEAPEGYRWVTGARKSAICWDKMKELAINEATGRFYQLEQWYATGIKPEGDQLFGQVTDKGIMSMGGMLYKKDMTLEEYLTAHGLASNQRLLPSPSYILQNEDWIADDTIESWDHVVANYCDSLPDDAVLVVIDVHQ